MATRSIELKNARRGKHRSPVARVVLVALVLTGCIAANVPRAPLPAMKPIMQVDYAVPVDRGPQRVEVLTRDIPPGAEIPWHTHPGIEIAYLESGELEALVSGSAPSRIRAGEHVTFERGTVHAARNRSGEPARLVITYVLDSDAPERTAAPVPEGY